MLCPYTAADRWACHCLLMIKEDLPLCSIENDKRLTTTQQSATKRVTGAEDSCPDHAYLYLPCEPMKVIYSDL